MFDVYAILLGTQPVLTMAHEVNVCVGLVQIKVLRLQVCSRHLIFDLLLDYLTELSIRSMPTKLSLDYLAMFCTRFLMFAVVALGLPMPLLFLVM